MDRLNLTRRPLLPLQLDPVPQEEGLREPFHADALTNRLRRLGNQHHTTPAENRRARSLYHHKAPQQPDQSSEKRLAPAKHLGTRFRGQGLR